MSTYPFGIVALIATFGYERVALRDRCDDPNPTYMWVDGARLPSEMLRPMIDHLVSLGSYRDNKVCYMYTDTYGNVCLLSLYDGRCTWVSFPSRWRKIPANVVKGAQFVQAALDSWHRTRELDSEARRRRNTHAYTVEWRYA